MSDIVKQRDIARRLEQTQVIERGLSGAGTAFPGSPATGMRFWRTDLGFLCYYDGTRWLTVQTFDISFRYIVGIAVTTEQYEALVNIGSDYQAYILRWEQRLNIGVTNTGAAYWDVNLRVGGTATIAQVSTSASAPSTLANFITTSGFTQPPAASLFLNISTVKVGAPSNLETYGYVRYRLIIP